MPNLLKIAKKTLKKGLIFTTLDTLQLKFLKVNHASGYIEENNGNKYLIFDDSVDENKEVLKKYADVWNGTKNKSMQ